MDLFGMLPALMPLLFIAGVGAIAYFAWKSAKERREAAQRYAAAKGWTYTREVPGLTMRWRSSPFGAGHSRHANDVLTGTFHGRQVVSLEYKYTTGSGKNSTTHFYHVLALNLPARLPWLQLTPDGAGAAVAKFFGGQDIQFESNDFNEAWRVQAPPGQYAYDVIHPRMMRRLMAPDAVGNHITIEGDDMFIAIPGRRDLAAVDYYANLLYGLIELIPRHVWQNVGYDPGASR